MTDVPADRSVPGPAIEGPAIQAPATPVPAIEGPATPGRAAPVPAIQAPATPGPATPVPAGEALAQPWFRSHPVEASAVIAVSSAAVLALQVLDHRASDAIALLYVLPISLAGVSFGVAGGLGAAAVAYLAFAVSALLAPAGDMGPDGWIGRAAAMFLLGGLLGRACDQTQEAARVALVHQRRRLMVEEQNRRYAEGIELSDSIIQHVTAAKWAIEQGDHDKAVTLLTRAISAGQEMVGELLPTHPGPLPPPRRPAPNPNPNPPNPNPPAVGTAGAAPAPGRQGRRGRQARRAQRTTWRRQAPPPPGPPARPATRTPAHPPAQGDRGGAGGFPPPPG